MKMLIFTEGTILMHESGRGHSREERVRQVVEDDCESIGEVPEMTVTHVRPEIRRKIKSITVEEFGGIDHLPDDVSRLRPTVESRVRRFS